MVYLCDLELVEHILQDLVVLNHIVFVLGIKINLAEREREILYQKQPRRKIKHMKVESPCALAQLLERSHQASDIAQHQKQPNKKKIRQ